MVLEYFYNYLPHNCGTTRSNTNLFIPSLHRHAYYGPAECAKRLNKPFSLYVLPNVSRDCSLDPNSTTLDSTTLVFVLWRRPRTSTRRIVAPHVYQVSKNAPSGYLQCRQRGAIGVSLLSFVARPRFCATTPPLLPPPLQWLFASLHKGGARASLKRS